jgi:opacity protein-like surface antigen
MTRCLPMTGTCLLATALATAALTAPLLAHAQTAAATSEVIVPMAIGRTLPTHSLRGKLMLTNPPEVILNGQADRLAPGSHIRGRNNMLVMVGAAIGNEYTVNYTRDSYGLIMDVWVLRDDEIAQRWPKTAEEAAKWTFDPLARTWTKP